MSHIIGGFPFSPACQKRHFPSRFAGQHIVDKNGFVGGRIEFTTDGPTKGVTLAHNTTEDGQT